MRDDDLVRELRELGAHLVTPPAPDLRAAVRQQISTPGPRQLPRRWLAAAAAGLIAILVAGGPPCVGATRGCWARGAPAPAAAALYMGERVQLGGQAAPRPSAVKLLHSVEATAPGSGSSCTSTRSTHLTH